MSDEQLPETVLNLDFTATPAGEKGASPPPAAEPPVRIGKYQIVKLLGRGGMGAVHQAYDPVLERDVALKVMLPQIADDPEQKQRFEREARAVGRLMHPSVVTVFDLGYHTDGSPYIVMELLRGRDLLHAMREDAPLPLQRKVTIILEVLEGLGHAHKVGIVHRDIKPANVFLTEDGVAKIMDFGIARFTAAAGTGSGAVLGTAGYMSPEQVRGERVDGRSDLFSVGSMFCELLGGHRPFDADTPMATLFRIAHGEPTLELPPGPEYARFMPVLRRALAKGLEERYATAAEFAAALRACLESSAPTVGAPAPAPAEGLEAGRSRRATDTAATTRDLQRPRPAPVAGIAKEPTTRPRADPSALFRLLREIYVGSKSGHLHFAVDHERKSLRILKGQIIHGTSDAGGEHLGDVLVRYGLLTQADLERAVAVVLRDRRRLGGVLSELGLIDRPRIEEAVGLHVREILHSVIDRPGVWFAFEEAAESTIETDLACPLSTGEVILEATRRVQDPELVRQVLGDMGRVLTHSTNPLLRAQKITLTPTDGFVLSRIDGTLSAREVVSLIPLPSEDTERSLFSLLSTGVIDYRADVGGKRAPGTGATRVAPRQGVPGATPPPSTARPAPPLTPPAPAARPSPPPGSPPAGSGRPASPPTAVPGAASTPAAPSPASRPATPETSEERRRTAAPAAQEVREIILAAHANLKRDHFEVLGIDRTATEAEVREAYARFARVLHPDACQDPSLTDLREKRDAVFSRLSQAFETLRDPESRARYEQAYEPSKLRPAGTFRPPKSPPPERTPPTAAPTPSAAPTPAVSGSAAPTSPPPSPPPPSAARSPSSPPVLDARLEPEHVLSVAQQLYEEERYWDAIQQLEPLIVRATGSARMRAAMLLAQAYLKNPMWKKRAEELLQRVVRENPQHVPALLLLADLYHASNLQARAKAAYRRVLELDPENREARSRMEALEPTGGGGLRSFFKRR